MIVKEVFIIEEFFKEILRDDEVNWRVVDDDRSLGFFLRSFTKREVYSIAQRHSISPVFFSDGVEDPLYILNQHRRRKELEYYHFTYDDLMGASDIEYKYRNPSIELFLEYLTKNFDINLEEAEDIYFTIEYEDLNDTPPNEILNMISENFEFQSKKDVEDFFGLYMNVMKNS
jgi:hypothetical protein